MSDGTSLQAAEALLAEAGVDAGRYRWVLASADSYGYDEAMLEHMARGHIRREQAKGER